MESTDLEFEFDFLSIRPSAHEKNGSSTLPTVYSSSCLCQPVTLLLPCYPLYARVPLGGQSIRISRHRNVSCAQLETPQASTRATGDDTRFTKQKRAPKRPRDGSKRYLETKLITGTHRDRIPIFYIKRRV